MLEDHERIILAAQGYSELGMVEDALAELDSLPEDIRGSPAVVETRIVILMQAQQWKGALRASRELCKIQADRPTGFIHTAYCLHEMGRTQDALDFLLNGPDILHGEPTFHYNLACYECRLGRLDLARAHLERSFQLDKQFRQFAKTDPDLIPLRDLQV